MSRKKCFKQAWKALAVHLVILSKGCENIKNSLAFFNKVKSSKLIPPPSITCWSDNTAIFEHLYHVSNGIARDVK
jgi:hypothetical protein